MDRNRNLTRVRSHARAWDVIVIGGGATGVGCALDAASRGYDVLLLEQHDLGKGTSSRSTKLIHGGVRYLRQGNIALVREALKERGILLRNAPHMVHTLEFIVPCYSLWDKLFYAAGLKIYDLLAGKYRVGNSRVLSKKETIERLPTIKLEGLEGGVAYSDGQFDDTRLLVDMAVNADTHGACILNYARVDAFVRDVSNKIGGVKFTDVRTGEEFSVAGRAVINATGIFCDGLRQMSDSSAAQAITFAQGTHLVFDRKFLSSDAAIMIPKTSDGRVLFCIPWIGYLLVGTTDMPVESATLEPQARESEIDFILETAGSYLTAKPTRKDILSVFAGIRPLVNKERAGKTSAISRGYELSVDDADLITITGGKWTTYRRMAEDAVDKAAVIGGLRSAKCRTETLAIPPPLPAEGERLHPDFYYTKADVLRAVRNEMALTVQDVLSRRTRALFLNARAAVEIAPEVAQIMAAEMELDEAWVTDQVAAFGKLAASYSAAPLIGKLR